MHLFKSLFIKKATIMFLKQLLLVACLIFHLVAPANAATNAAAVLKYQRKVPKSTKPTQTPFGPSKFGPL